LEERWKSAYLGVKTLQVAQTLWDIVLTDREKELLGGEAAVVQLGARAMWQKVRRGTDRQAVIAVAIAIYAVYGNAAPATAQGWLMMAGGLLIFLVGSWLFLQRIRGHADHVHLFQDSQSTARVGWLRVVLLGLGGGIIPCWDAVLLFLVAMAQGRIGFAIPLLVAFSTGLALVLVLLGVGVVYANRAGGRRFAGQKWFRYLPVASAVLLVILGIWFLRDGYQVLSAAQN